MINSKLKDRINFYSEFKSWYFKILDDFKFDYEKDCTARNYLSEILQSKTIRYDLEKVLLSFKSHIENKPYLLIYGCGPSLEETVKDLINLKKDILLKQSINLAADGASVFLKENSVPVDAIFTDLDGITQDEFNYSYFNIVHAHGDNIEKLRDFEKDISNFENVIGTTQVEPCGNIINPGGFTDGDRILYFIRILTIPSQKIFLIGMDFNGMIGKYSKLDYNSHQISHGIKKKKLHYAIKLLEWIQPKMRNKIFLVNSKNLPNNFNFISLEEFMQTMHT
ncbi:MAG: 6-hydroxymethylpterin diphosphokinase MptE-like protein [Promethearchaeota archaeon]|jgi:uncharacterized Rossmann fold enzyme